MLERISRAEAWELLEPQTGGFVPAAIDDGLWYATPDCSFLGVLLPDDRRWRFTLLRRDPATGTYYVATNGNGYSAHDGAERSMLRRAASFVERPA